MALEVIILAAGQGTRMRSSLPKVLHPVAGRPMLGHVVDTVEKLSAEKIHVVIGHGAEQVKTAMMDKNVCWALQAEQLGTGHAVAQALPAVSDDAVVLVAYGDVPLVAEQTLRALVAAVDNESMALLTVKLADPTGYGRIVRNTENKITEIVEQKDASEAQLLINEVNTGILATHAKKLKSWLPKLSANNAQGEYYLTDIIAMAVAEGLQIVAQHPANEWEVQGVNNRQQQSELERIFQWQQAQSLMVQGVTLADPSRLDIRGTLTAGKDVFIDINCLFVGNVVLGDGVTIGPNCVIENTTIASGSTVNANSILEDSQLAQNCVVGPFARLRPGTVLAASAKIGNFVETKKAIIGEGSKVNHLSYIGDSEIGNKVNVGAGTITCNYDGVNKHKTVIEDGSFIGSNTAIVAPVTIGRNATVGAGSTITHNIDADQLSVARGRQRNIDNWVRPQKKT